MSSESDPLLPKGNTAPEITGYGFTPSSKRQPFFDSRSQLSQPEEEDGKDAVGQPSGRPSPLRTILAIFSIVVVLAFVITLSFPGAVTPTIGPPEEDSPSNMEDRVKKILSDTPLIDGHDDLAFLIRYLYHNNIYHKNFTSKFEKDGLPFHVDLPRLKAGKSGGAFWSAWVPCPKDGMDLLDGNYAEAVTTTISQIDLLHRLLAAHPSTFSPPTLTSSSAHQAFKANNHFISPLGIEGLHQIGNSASTLRLYHSLGVKYATLTHNCHNAFADAALITTPSSNKLIAAPPHWGGLSERGIALIREMNRMGMLIDLSHVSKDTMLDVLGGRPEKTQGSIAPVMFSHSSAFALCPHPRNVADDVLQLVKKTNSVVMVNFSPDFISCVVASEDDDDDGDDDTMGTGLPEFYAKNATLHQVARHVMHIGQLIGYEHVGLGSDFDGILDTPSGLEDVSKFPDLVAELLRMGVGERDVRKVVGLNVLRVWRDAEKLAEKMQGQGVLPLEDEISRVDIS